MQEEIQSENELSLSDIFYALLSKIKILILVFVLGCMAGVGLGFVTTFGVHYYGTNLEFYITPTLKEGGTVSGESTNAVYGAYGKNVMDNMVKLLSSESFTATLIDNKGQEGGLPDKDEYTVTKYDEHGEVTKEYAKLLNKVQNAISFSYILANESSNTNDLARSFIYVEISVLGDSNEQFAKDLLKVVKVAVPAYIEANMIIPSGYDGTSCSSTTVLEAIHRTNENYARNTMIKYAALLGLASLVVACVVVVIVDRSDKRLRDYDLVAKKFNVPVLGVIPAIEGMSRFVYKTNDSNKTEEQK